MCLASHALIVLQTDDNESTFGEQNGIVPLINVLETHCLDPEVMEQACLCVTNVTANGDECVEL